MTSQAVAGALAEALADRYRIERELGQGGMATVYLAEDLKHRRRVAVKVLRPDLAQSLGSGRFLREIEIAARLSHPHILPLHDSGEAGGFLYYVMPFVEGESLRQRLAREGALPPADAARFLREIADALAHAHAQGVVHRDIKPENVMLSGRHALVMDFGVAKAVREAAGEGLTTVGVTLGTPAYMAPEQAIADPHIDHRADIYALGAVGYEMLTGRPLYAGMTPQQVLAAHVTRPPDAVPATVNGLPIPPPLVALVMRCLAKQADARPQHAGDVVSAIESLGAAGPPGESPVVSDATAAAVHRAHPLRVALLFAAAAAVVLALAAFLTFRLGLPGWVVTGAALLLLIGFPIMLVTGFQERRRALARTTAVHVTPPETLASRHFTWRKAILGGVAAFAGLAIVTGAYTAMRLLGIGPVGTLVATGALAERDRLLLADFENRTADPTLGGSLTEALRVDLSQSRTVRLVDGAEIRQTLVRMQRPPDTPLTADIAREMADRVGVKAVVAGQVSSVGTGYVLSANLLAAGDGRVLAAVRETADDSAELLRAIDQLSGKLRERIGESLVAIRANPPLEQVTTGSLPALRRYSEGVRLADQDRLDDAIPLLEQAIALDSGFAMAWRKLAVALNNSFASEQRQDEAATKAFELRDRLPAVERELAAAYYYGDVENDFAKEAATYRVLLSLDPENGVALNNLALNYNQSRRYAEAESLAARAVAGSNNAASFLNVLVAQVAQGRSGAAHATVAEAVRRFAPDSPNASRFKAFLALATGHRDSAAWYMEQIQREHRTPERQARASDVLWAIAETEGRLADAAEHLRAFMATSEIRELPRDYVSGAARLAEHEIQYRNRPDRALALLDEALRRHPLDSIAPADRPYLEIALVYAAANLPAEARRVLREFEAVVPESIRRGEDFRGRVYGRVAESEGRFSDAAAAYTQYYAGFGMCGTCGLFELARLKDRLGQSDSARVLYERMVTTPTIIGHIIASPSALAPSYKRLGELYEARGDRVKAAEYYGRFVDLWKNADAELQPGVKEVRQRLARLSQEPGA